MRLILPFIFYLLAIGCAQSARTSNPPVAVSDPPRRIVAYLTGGSPIWRIDPNKLTHINYAFAQVSADGDAVFNNPAAAGASLAQLQALKAKNPNLKIIVSVGGWGADHFSDAAFSDESRTRFAKSAAEMIEKYGLDGIDIDWEYPGQSGGGQKFRAEDKHNFTLYLKALREQLDTLSEKHNRPAADHYLLTIASADREYFDHTEMDKLHVYLDWVNIMAYDFYNSLTKTTGHHTGLYQSVGAAPDSRWAEKSVKQHLAAGIPPNKLVLGVAFYGRGFEGVENDPPVNQPYKKNGGAPSYSELREKFVNKSGFERRWDDAAQAPYLWNAKTQTMISYDDEQSLRAKCAYIREQHLGGVMYWEESHDPDERLLTLLHQQLATPGG